MEQQQPQQTILDVNTLKLVFGLAKVGAVDEETRQVIDQTSAVTFNFLQAMNQEIQSFPKRLEEAKKEWDAEIEARIASEVSAREEVIRKELLEMNHSNGKGKS